MNYHEYVNQKLWLCTEQPAQWRERLADLEARYNE